MYWWNEQPNFGDALNPIILKKLFGKEAIWSPLETAELVGAGSCLQWVAKAVRKNPHEMHVWGTGYIFDEEPAVESRLVTHHAIRGQYSKEYGHLNEAVLGDPGVLSPLLFNKTIPKRYKVGIVPHLWNMNDTELKKTKDLDLNVSIIDVTRPPLEVIEKIAACEFIFSSSLHGLIVADSFGIPNQWVTFDRIPFGSDWKFNDYYSIYNLKSKPRSEEFAAHFFNIGVEDRINNFENRSGIDEIQKALIGSFPKSINN